MSDDDCDLSSMKCWCGAEGGYDELFDRSIFDESCGGTGTLICLCGGDSCVRHNHGEAECPGCEDCRYDGDDYGDDFDDA